MPPPSPHVIVVDDDPAILSFVEFALKREEFSVSKATDAESALAMLEGGTPDLFILDIMLPGMDGLELCRLLRSRPDTEAVPILFLTARVRPEDIQAGYDAGGTGYMTKPVEPGDLVAQARAALGLDEE